MTGTESTLDLQQRWSNSLMDNYGVPRVALVRGEGAVLTDADGKQYLDLLAGIAVNILGHAHPAVIEAVTGQLSTLGHTSNLYATEPGIALAEQLLAHLGAGATGRVFLCNSGTEANEAAFKIALAPTCWCIHKYLFYLWHAGKSKFTQYRAIDRHFAPANYTKGFFFKFFIQHLTRSLRKGLVLA